MLCRMLSQRFGPWYAIELSQTKHANLGWKIKAERFGPLPSTDIFKNLKAFFATGGAFNFICHQELLPNVCENELHGRYKIRSNLKEFNYLRRRRNGENNWHPLGLLISRLCRLIQAATYQSSTICCRTIKYQFVFNCKLKATPKSRQHILLRLRRQRTHAKTQSRHPFSHLRLWHWLPARTMYTNTYQHTHTQARIFTQTHSRTRSSVVPWVCSANKPKRD